MNAARSPSRYRSLPRAPRARSRDRNLKPLLGGLHWARVICASLLEHAGLSWKPRCRSSGGRALQEDGTCSLGRSQRACFSDHPSRRACRKSSSKKIIHKSDREPTTPNSCAKLKASQTPTLVPAGRPPPGTFFCPVGHSASLHAAGLRTGFCCSRDTSQHLLVRVGTSVVRRRCALHHHAIGDVNHMSKVEDYRLTAAEIVECAQQAKSVLEKRRLLRLAEMWLDLPVRSGRKAAQAQRRIQDHPLLRKTLGSGPAGVS